MQEKIEELPSVKRANIWLKDHGLKKESWARRIFLWILDLALISGLIYYCYIINEDWAYWQTAPWPFHAFMVVQYVLICLAIRLPIIDMNTHNQTRTIMIIVVLLVFNTCAGLYMFRKLTSCEDGSCDDGGKRFVLQDEYVVHGILLILVPASVFVFLLIVIVKLICFILADRKKSRNA